MKRIILGIFMLLFLLVMIAGIFTSCNTEKRGAMRLASLKTTRPKLVASFCGENYPVKESTTHTIEYRQGKHDTIWQNEYIDCDTVIGQNQVVRVPYPVHIPVHDTIQIISDYSRIYAYNDTINMDSSRFIINDTISQNRIIGRKFNASIAEKTITINNTKIIQPKNAIYVGGDLTSYNGRLEPNIGIGFKMPSGLFMAKYGTLGYSIGYYKKL